MPSKKPLPPTTSDAPPAQWGRYRLLRKIGAGGMAEVFLAKAPGAEGTEKLLVLKRILPSFARQPKFIAMFVDEAKVAMRLNHPNIVQVYHFEQVRDEFLLAMEHVEGVDLSQLIALLQRRGMRLPWGVTAHIIMEVAKALDYAHRRRDEQGESLEIVHRDVSPQNILLSFDGSVKLADFGIAKARMGSQELGVVKGKFNYMSPEQARGEKVDGRSDIYSLGVLLCEMLMGRRMYPRARGMEAIELIKAGHLTLPSQVDPTVPDELDRIARKATMLRVEERYAHARALASALSKYLHQQNHVYDAESVEALLARLELRPSALLSAVSPTPPGVQRTFAGERSTGTSTPRLHRERRHVVVLSGLLRAEGAAFEEVAQLRRMLDEMAYKADAVLQWSLDGSKDRFHLLLGLASSSLQMPLQALHLAHDLLEAFQEATGAAAIPISVRVGMARGVVTTTRDAQGRLLSYDAAGGLCDVADRLAQNAQPWQVCVTGQVFRLVRRDFAFEEVGPCVVAAEASAEAASIRVYRALGRYLQRPLARPSSAIVGVESIVGRHEELKRLMLAFRRCATEARSACFVLRGDVGVGKSAVLAALEQALTATTRVLRVECSFANNDQPMAAVVAMLRDVCGVGEGDEPALAKRKCATVCLDLFPHAPRTAAQIASALDGLWSLPAARRPSFAATPTEGGRTPNRSLGGILMHLLAALARRRPLIVLLDGMQWIDDESLWWLTRLARRAPRLPVLFLGASRPDATLEARLPPEVTVLQLAELGMEESHQLLRQHLAEGQLLSPQAEQAILTRGSGNPLFLLELLEALAARGGLSGATLAGGDASVGTAEGGRTPSGAEPSGVRLQVAEMVAALPTTIEGVVSAHLQGLPQNARRVLHWLAVAGRGLRVDDLGQLLQADVAVVIDRLRQDGLVETNDAGTLSFSSSLTRQVTLGLIDVADAASMHRRLAHHWLERAKQGRRPVSAARMARHWEMAGEAELAAQSYIEAAEEARRVYSNRDALRCYAKAQSMLQDASPLLLRLHEGRAQILRGSGQRRAELAELVALRDLAQHLADPAMVSLACNRLARHHLDGDGSSEVEGLLQRALQNARAAGVLGGEVEALRLRAQELLRRGDIHDALGACEEALRKAADLPDLMAARGSLLAQRAKLLRHLGRLPQASQTAAEAVVIFHRLGLKRNESQALYTLGTVLEAQNDLLEALRALRLSVALDNEIGDRFRVGGKLQRIGRLYDALGDPEQAQRYGERARIGQAAEG